MPLPPGIFTLPLLERFSGTDMGMGDTDADTATITITSVQTRVTGDPALTMLADVVMPTASIAERDRQEAVFIPDQL